MNLRGALGRLIRVYFWILLLFAVVTVGWLLTEFVVPPGVLASGWFAVAGFGLMIVLFLSVLKRVAR